MSETMGDSGSDVEEESNFQRFVRMMEERGAHVPLASDLGPEDEEEADRARARLDLKHRLEQGR